VLEEETGNKSNATFASRRVYELTEGVAQIHQPRRSNERESFAMPAPASSRPTGNPGSYESARQSAYGGGHDEPTEDGSTNAERSHTQRHGENDEMVPVVDLGPDQ
jgi:hypothetical protein